MRCDLDIPFHPSCSFANDHVDYQWGSLDRCDRSARARTNIDGLDRILGGAVPGAVAAASVFGQKNHQLGCIAF